MKITDDQNEQLKISPHEAEIKAVVFTQSGDSASGQDGVM